MPGAHFDSVSHRVRTPRIIVDVSSTVRGPGLNPSRVRDLVVATLESERVREALISVALVGTGRMQRLNRQFLNHHGPTDVISFALSPKDDAVPVIGDIYVCPRIAERNARRLGVSLRDELARLVVHGTLHVLGYEHPENEARTSSPMWRKQERILDSVH
jgi:probable rRNA maturation factor